jgi:hypothetical protein
MRITLVIHMLVNGIRSMKCGEFNVKKSEDIPRFAHDWIKSIRMETGYFGNQSIIEKVIYNGKHDITHQVKEIDNAPIPDLDFPW